VASSGSSQPRCGWWSWESCSPSAATWRRRLPARPRLTRPRRSADPVPHGGTVDGQLQEVPVHGYTANKDDYLKRLRRIEGQVRGIAKMVDEDKYCIDILTQVSAATKALQSVALGLLEEHMGSCVVEAARAG